MPRLKLSIDNLQVDSFATSVRGTSTGTVNAYGYDMVAPVGPSYPEGTCVETCTPLQSDPHTCQWTCNDDTCTDGCRTGPKPATNPCVCSVDV